MFVTQREYDDMKAYYTGRIAQDSVQILRLQQEMYDYQRAQVRVMDRATEEITRLNKQIKKPCMHTFEIFCQDENVYIDAAKVLLQDGQIKFFDVAGNIVGFVPATTIVRRWEIGE